MKLKITTIRNLSKDDFQEYKKVFPYIDYDELEKTGRTELKTHQEGEDVISVYELKD